MNNYEVDVTVTLKHPRGLNKECSRVCSFSWNFLAVPGNVFAICQVEKKWFFGTIEYASSCPTYLVPKHAKIDDLIEIYAETYVQDEAEFAKVEKELKKLKWTVVKET